jgi:hypothetical protein
MTAEGFYKYIGLVFAPHLGKQNVKFPVILFVSGYCTHLTYQLNELCSELSIILISLCPSATRQKHFSCPINFEMVRNTEKKV